jgi:tetratricopeptide (TPR) repeat protein
MINKTFDNTRYFFTKILTIISLIINQGLPVLARESEEIYQIVVPITVLIDGDDRWGTGVIIAKEGKTYTVLTNHHVVCQPNAFVNTCKTDRNYKIVTYRGKTYKAEVIKPLQTGEYAPDLAVLTFSTTEDYPIAVLGDSNQLSPGQNIWVYGFPGLGQLSKEQPQPQFTQGSITSIFNHRKGNYTINYSAWTKPGMSGGPVLDSEGQLIGIHGQAYLEYMSVFKDNQETRDFVKVSTDINSAIPIDAFIAIITERELRKIKANSIKGRVLITSDYPNTFEDDYTTRGISRLNQGNYQNAIDDFSKIIELNTNNASAYLYRGHARTNLKDYAGAIADYNLAIQLDPNLAHAYAGRGILRHDYFKDYEGAFSDLNRAIDLDPKYFPAYNNRGLIRHQYFKDYLGAITDYNLAIELAPHNPWSYHNRGLSYYMLGDKQQARADWEKAAKLYRQLVNQPGYEQMIDNINNLL